MDFLPFNSVAGGIAVDVLSVVDVLGAGVDGGGSHKSQRLPWQHSPLTKHLPF